jgi:hypothetical protein
MPFRMADFIGNIPPKGDVVTVDLIVNKLDRFLISVIGKGIKMFGKFLRSLAFLAGVSGLALPVAAATMTFSNINLDPTARTYSEDGIFASGNGTLGIYAAGALHFDDGGSSAPSKVSFTMASHFNAVSFLLDPVNFALNLCSSTLSSCTSPTYANVLVQGYRDGALVSNLLFDMGASPDPYTVALGNLFNNLSALVIGIPYPNLALFEPLPAGSGIVPCAPCSHFNIDNVTLAPVPLPASLPLAASGLAILGFLARRRRQSV